MLAILHLLGTFVANLSSRSAGLPQRLQLSVSDRALSAWMTWLWPSLLGFRTVLIPQNRPRGERTLSLIDIASGSLPKSPMSLSSGDEVPAHAPGDVPLRN